MNTFEHTLRFILLALIGGITARGNLPAQTPGDTAAAAPWYASISVNGFLSTAYVFNCNRPDVLRNQYRVFDFADNSIKVDVMELSLKKDAGKSGEAGFRVDLTAGSSVPRISRSSGLEIGDLDFHQMFLSYVAPLGNGLQLTAGKFITSMGYEVIEGYDGYNDNYSRSLLFGYAIPFTHTGIRAGYSFSNGVSAMLMVVNGWDNAVDSNSSKSVSGQMGFTPLKGMNLFVNYMTGPEQPGNDSDNRRLLDIVGTYALSGLITAGVNGDYGEEDHSDPGGTATWAGAAIYLRFNLERDLSVSVRGEEFEDRDGIRTGAVQNLREVTFTPEFRPADHLVLRMELRVDRSDREVFQKANGWSGTQATIAANALFTF